MKHKYRPLLAAADFLATAMGSRALPSTSTTLTALSTAVSEGTKVTLTASVTSGSGSLTKGQVIFCNASATYCEGSAYLGIAQVTSAGTAVLPIILGPGSPTVQANFLGTTSFASSSSSTQTIKVTAGVFSTTASITPSGSAGNYTLKGQVVGSPYDAPTCSVRQVVVDGF